MNKPHATLRVGPNIIMIVLWGIIALGASSMCEPRPILLMCIGAGLGLIGGYMQLLSFRQLPKGFAAAETMMAVRAQLKATKWGKLYIYFFWSSVAVLCVFSLLLSNNPVFAFLAGDFSMKFVREMVTLKLTFELRQVPGLEQ